MYGSEGLERSYLDYQSEWVPRRMTLQAYCSRSDVPYKVMENYSRNIQKKIVEVKVGSRRGLDYVGLRLLIEKLEVIC